MFVRLEKEIWIVQFAETLAKSQPRFPVELGREIAATAWPYMSILTPKIAVATLLQMAHAQRQTDPESGFPSDRA